MFNIELTLLLFRIPAAFCALVLHEMVKARCSAWQGDPTPEKHGLMKGNPLKYLEPIGFIITVIFGFGWGRPTPTSPLYYKDRKKGIFITYLTPSLVNLFVGLLVALIVGIYYVTEVQVALAASPHIAVITSRFFLLLSVFAQCSISIAFFNMIPVPPLDASKLLLTALSPNTAVKVTQNEKLLQLVLMLLMVMGVISMIILPITDMLMSAAVTW